MPETTQNSSAPDPSSHSPRNRRRQLLVLREMQGRIIKETTLFPLVALAILTVTLTVFSRRLMAEAAAEEVVLPTLEPLLAAVICLTAGFAVTILYVALRFSQRIAGPTYRITQALKEVHAESDEVRIKLRDGDFLEEIADEINLAFARVARGPAGTQEPCDAPDVDVAPSLVSERAPNGANAQDA